VFFLIRQYVIKQDWVLTAQVALPSEAARIMTTVGQPYPQAAPQWVGAAVMLGYGLMFGLIGAMITKRRDVA
jgi:ABC-2 type transport system permease protein